MARVSYIIMTRVSYIIMARVSYIIMARVSYIRWDDDDEDDVIFVLDQHAELNFYSVISLKQHSAGRYVAPLWHVILIPRKPVFPHTP